LWDYQVVSDFDLGELESASDDCRRGTLQIKLPAEVLRVRRESDVSREGRLDHRLNNGHRWFTSWKSGDAYIARFPKVCSFRFHPEAMVVECSPERDAAESTIAHLILDHAIPRLLSLLPDHLVIHASAVQVEGQAVAILGQSGQGKSTVAAWFASQGFPLLTDDCLALRWDNKVQQWLAQPSYQSVRLWPDSVDALRIGESALREFAYYSAKKRTGREVDFEFATGEVPLKACFILTGPEKSDGTASRAPEIRPLSTNEGFLALVQSVFRLDAENAQLNSREFEALTSLTDRVRFRALSYERKYSRLPEVQKAMIDTIRAGKNEPVERKLP
jgi:ABC-type uncharacterized transport system YnjBCD ATPase subunit